MQPRDVVRRGAGAEDKQQDACRCGPALPACLRRTSNLSSQERVLERDGRAPVTTAARPASPRRCPHRLRPEAGAPRPSAAPSHGFRSVSDTFTAKSREGSLNPQPQTVSLGVSRAVSLPLASPQRLDGCCRPRLTGLSSGRPQCPAAFASALSVQGSGRLRSQATPCRSPPLRDSTTCSPRPPPLPLGGPRWDVQPAASPCRTCPGAAGRCPSTRGSWSARRSEGRGALGRKGQQSHRGTWKPCGEGRRVHKTTWSGHV